MDSIPVGIGEFPRLFVLACLVKIGAVARTIERDLALLTAALRADSSVHRRAESLLLTLFANGTTHRDSPRFHYDMHEKIQSFALC